MTTSLRILLSGTIDYAGLFPPARLDMVDATQNYGAYRDSEHSWALGRFVLPVSRLAEFQRSSRLWARKSHAPWPLAVLGGPEMAADVAHIIEFNQRHTAVGIADTLEEKDSGPVEVRQAKGLLPESVHCYFETPLGDDPTSWLDAIRAAGARAKGRTGGLTAEMFPSAAELVRFLSACVSAGVAFKLTAGLHHPLRSTRPFTYEPNSPSGPMHGFLNALIATALLHAGVAIEEAKEALEEESPHAFGFGDDSVTWRGHRIDTGQLRRMREGCFISFGSCSFDEPISELRRLGLL